MDGCLALNEVTNKDKFASYSFIGRIKKSQCDLLIKLKLSSAELEIS